MGDRRDHFTIKGDTWTMLTTIMEERKRRELEPTLTLLRQCVIEAAEDKETPAEVKARIEQMLTFIATLTEWFDQVKALPKSTLVALMKMGAKIAQTDAEEHRARSCNRRPVAEKNLRACFCLVLKLRKKEYDRASPRTQTSGRAARLSGAAWCPQRGRGSHSLRAPASLGTAATSWARWCSTRAVADAGWSGSAD